MPPPHTDITSATELAQQLAQDIATRADEADRLGKLPVEDVRALKESGYLTLSVPREYGGQGLSMRDCLAAHLELAQGSASTALVAAMQMHIFGHAREAHPWPEEWFERFCRAAVEDHALFNSVASEPSLGSPSRGGLFETCAEPAADGWVINGHKTWTTGGQHLTHMLVSLTVENEPALMLVLQDSPGVQWVETWGDNALSLRASDSHDVYFVDVQAPHDHLILRGANDPLPNTWFPMTIAAVYLGTAMAARNTLIQYALERVPTALGKPIATLPKIQRQIGEIDVALQAARALLLEVAGEWTGHDHRQQLPRIVAAKYIATETAIDVTDMALRAAGGSSLTRALPLERYFRDVRAGLMHPPSGDTAMEMVGKSAVEDRSS
jgi:alkylation response protein AidB-like acyl-CoA dehydrogenase